VEAKRSAAYSQGIWVGLGLAVLTVIEFVISQAMTNGGVFLILIALIKAVVIIYYFMHVYRLWQAEEH
jgi:heme/copper-type cytochrome/quinol oxidase subunit 4